MIARPMQGLVDVERTPSLTLAPGPNTTDPHSSCDRFLSRWPASTWPPMRLPLIIWGRKRPARHPPRPLTLNLDLRYPAARREGAVLRSLLAAVLALTWELSGATACRWACPSCR